MNQAKRLAAVEKALALLLQLEKYYILLRKDDTEAEAIQWHIEQGLLDPEKQEPVFILSQIPGKSRRVRCTSNADLPELAPKKKEPEPAPLPTKEEYEPAAAPVKAKPKRTRLNYPEQVY
jgi:hypothetical protein